MTEFAVTAEDHLAQVKAVLEMPADNPQRKIAEQCLEIAVLLLEKNASYGNAALAPVSIFSRGTSARAKIDVRIDDKLTRIARGHEYGDEDVMFDLLGYLVLRRIATAAEKAGVTR